MAYWPWGRKENTTKEKKCNIIFLAYIWFFNDRHLENEMATHSSIFAWEIPWTEEHGGLQFMGSQKSQSWLSNWTTSAMIGNCHTWKLFSSLWSWKQDAWRLWVSPNSDVSFLKSFLVYSGSATLSLLYFKDQRCGKVKKKRLYIT